MLEKHEGLVIRAVSYGEANIILTVFTKERGKIALMARGAKKTTSRFAAVSQLFSYGLFHFHYRPSSMSTLSQGEVLESFSQVRADIEKTAYAAYVCELLDGVTTDHEASPSLFTLVLTVLRFLENGEDAEVLLRMVELKLTKTAGIKPELDRCVNCGITAGDFSFSVKEAGFLCETCSKFDTHRFLLTSRQVQLMRTLYYIEPERLGQIRVKPETKTVLHHLLESYYDTYSGLMLKSKRFLDQWQQWKP
ncbi:DNA repair protein RecO [Salicibibacter cibarius]|uniref:DNA repair protein RecO n=1 Tax=Salicibibacter cibarius TaxID=2743000 RepID=A0A7T6Z315_9BACI|nr:DNA repair protein RecO [Salicibibacter cibarius]QQK75831.1 DNA repair protein RecO [Salicibibacter cibarius]